MNKFKLAAVKPLMLASAVASAFALSFNAHADADNYTLQSVTPNSPYVIVTIDYTGAPKNINISAVAGMFNMVNAHEPPNSGLDFKAFCVDIFNTLHIGDTYYMHTTNNPLAISPAWTSLTLDRVSYLFDSYADQITGNEAAFQLTLWEIINEDDSNSLNLAQGDAKFLNITKDTARDTAQGWLDEIQNAADEYGKSKFFNFSFYQPDPHGDKSGNNAFQTVMTWTPCGDNGCNPPQEVPEPMPLALIGLGLLGLGFITRKSQSSDNYSSDSYSVTFA